MKLAIMPANIVDASLDSFLTVVKEAEAQGPGVVLILFLGDLVASTGVSWCPDCAKAEPVIYEQVNRVGKLVTLVRVYVGDRAAWRTPEHALRNDQHFRVTGVPTLIRWENGGIAGRLEDDDAGDAVKIQRLVRSRSASGSPRPRSTSKSSS